MVQIAPSLLAADFSALGEEVKRVAAADLLHVDVMDGVFVPNISIGPVVAAAMRKHTALPFDVHLMLLHPGRYIRPFREAGANRITFHIECQDDPAAVIAEIRESGALPGLAISPDTDPHALLPYAGQIAGVTVMTVYPGFGGQTLMPKALTKVKWLKDRLPSLKIEVDGGVTLSNAGQCAEMGADILVAGTAIFGEKDAGRAIEALRRAAVQK